ncbi:MAG: phenylalanine--tRNA ligase subunit beta, partial [Hyphomicrobiales bacterium]
PLPLAQPVPRHQAVERDIAVVVVEAVTHEALMEGIESASAAAGLLQGATLFDIYRPQGASGGLAPGEKSMAVRLSFQSDAATLTDEQIEPAVRAIVDRLGAQLGARLRG